MDDGSTLPVPFNMIPTPKSIYYIWRSFRFLFSRKANGDWLDYQRARKKTFIKVSIYKLTNLMNKIF